MEIEEDEARAKKRREMLEAAQNKPAKGKSPSSPIPTGAMDTLLQKLRDAGPTQRQQRDARKRARLKNNAKQRKASATLDAGLSGDDGASAEKEETGLSSGGGGGGGGEGEGVSDVGTDADTPALSSPTIAGGDTPAGSNTSGVPRKVSRQRSPDDDPASRAQNMLQALKSGGDVSVGDESDSVSLASLGSFRTSRRPSTDEGQGRRARRRQRQASSSVNGGGASLLNGASALGIDPGPATGEDAAARAKSLLLSMSARRGSAEENGTPISPPFLGLSGEASGSAVVDEPTVVGGSDSMPTPTIEIKEVD